MDHNSFDCQEKKSKMIPVHGYEADLEILKIFYCGKIFSVFSAPKKPRKLKQIHVISEQETSDLSKSSENDDNPMLSVIQEEEINLFIESSK